MADIAVHGARTRQLDELRDEVRQRSDTENDPHITDAELTRWINQSAARWWGHIVRARGEQYVMTTATPSTVAGTATVAVPSDFFKLKGIQWDRGSSKRQRIHRIELQDFLRLDVDSRDWTTGRLRVMVEGTNFRFHPTPNAVYNLIVWYIPAAPQLSADDDTLDGVNGWEEWVVLDAAIKVMAKQKRDSSLLEDERKLVMKDIQSVSDDVDDGEPGYVVDSGGIPITELFPELKRP